METQAKENISDVPTVAFIFIASMVLLGVIALVILFRVPDTGSQCLDALTSQSIFCSRNSSPESAQATLDAWAIQQKTAVAATQTAAPVVIYQSSEMTVKRIEDPQTKSFIYFCTSYDRPVPCDTKEQQR